MKKKKKKTPKTGNDGTMVSKMPGFSVKKTKIKSRSEGIAVKKSEKRVK